MPPPDSADRLPTWVFVLADVALLGAAWYLARQNPGPLSHAALLAISACVIVGACLLTVPLILNYEQKKNELLDARQRSLEALAATVTSSAEQISIAASGLHEIAMLAQKNLQAAELLPEKLRGQLEDVSERLDGTQAEEKAELERELAALRSTETLRLENLADKIAQSTAEWKTLEAATRKHLHELRDTFASIAAVSPPTQISENPVSALTEKLTGALAAIEARLAALPSANESSAPLPFDLEAALEADSKPAPAKPSPEEAATNSKLHLLGEVSAMESGTIPFPPTASADETKERAKTNSADAMPEPSAENIPPVEPPLSEKSPAMTAGAPESLPEGEARPLPVGKPARKRTPKPAPITPEESAGPIVIPPAAEAANPADELPAESEKSPEAENFSQITPEEINPTPAVAADGLTRLIVTAYIGIGNRLYLRGEGPGLNWEKGAPLQFVSIGKWRWESAEATVPIQFKIFKNDMQECAGLGTQILAPGRQLELSATF